MESEVKEIKAGTSLTVVLPGLGTAGFQWFYQVSNAACVDVRPYDHAVDTFRQDVGTSNEEAFIINGKSPGHASVTFEQRRIWEKEGQAINARRLEITVT
ncbi:protease inhibitor I42 family protein [Chitinophaga filiformis]|uniref:Protease inhibitor I42 family protein n=1 Tax=Chitinophaga filiformis TaxID=104663 RepID=A0ABY4I7U1_CHIFI|nr:protease inhibitor I42 family protein [Chitinophaga filiformis]UPK72154.1 protease inhibitor I42 family protein [Chitinophaga filiformis]